MRFDLYRGSVPIGHAIVESEGMLYKIACVLNKNCNSKTVAMLRSADKTYKIGIMVRHKDRLVATKRLGKNLINVEDLHFFVVEPNEGVAISEELPFEKIPDLRNATYTSYGCLTFKEISKP